MIYRLYRKKYFEPCCISLLLLIFFLLATTSLIRKSPTFDEPVHLTGGYAALVKKDFRVNPENGIFPQLWAASPLILDHNIKLNTAEDPGWKTGTRWEIADNFIFSSGNDFEKMFFISKIMMLIIAVAVGIVVYFASKSIWGNPGGYISLFIFSFSPTVIAHSRLITSDMPAAGFFLFSTWLFYKLLQNFTLGRLLLFCTSISLLALSKMSAIIILPVLLAIACVRIFLKKRIKIQLINVHFELKKQAHQVTAIVASLFFAGFFAYCFIWMTFGFRYSMLADETCREKVNKSWEIILENKSLSTDTISFTKEHHLLPEAYLYGFGFVLKKSSVRSSFLNGKYSLTGWRSFFPYCFVMKTPVAVILMFLLGLIGPFILSMKKKINIRIPHLIWRLSFPLFLIIIYSVFSVFSNLNIGQRHLLPIYLPIFIVAGGTGILIRKNNFAGTVGVALICFSLLFDNINMYPDYLAYFSPFFGGPANGYKHLVDSSLDWGQDLKGVRNFLQKEHQNEPNVYIAYFGTVNLNQFNMPQKRLLCYFEQNLNDVFILKGGTYCISATMLQMTYWPEFAEFKPEHEKMLTAYKNQFDEINASLQSPEKLQELIKQKGRPYLQKTVREYELLRFAKLCSVLRMKKPDKMIGYSYLVYNLTDDDIHSIFNE